MFGLRGLESSYLVFAGEPFEPGRINKDITGMRATGELAATRTMAILEYVFRSLELVGDSLTQATALNGITHTGSLPVVCSVAQASIGQQIGCQ